MRNWQLKYPSYQGEEPYLFFAFAGADAGKAWGVMRLLLRRGCRVWYCLGPAGSSEELLRRQSRAEGARLTVLYLTDAACADKDTKSMVLVNQKFGRPILCLDPDGTDRRLFMGVKESVPHVSLQGLSDADAENAVVHAEGFSQDMLGQSVKIDDGGTLGKVSAALLALALLISAVSFAGYRYLHWFQPEYRDEVTIADPVLLSAVRKAAGGGDITEELAGSITFLRLEEIPASWDGLDQLPALERIALPQSALLGEGELPTGDYVIELSGGGE